MPLLQSAVTFLMAPLATSLMNLPASVDEVKMPVFINPGSGMEYATNAPLEEGMAYSVGENKQLAGVATTDEIDNASKLLTDKKGNIRIYYIIEAEQLDDVIEALTALEDRDDSVQNGTVLTPRQLGRIIVWQDKEVQRLLKQIKKAGYGK